MKLFEVMTEYKTKTGGFPGNTYWADRWEKAFEEEKQAKSIDKTESMAMIKTLSDYALILEYANGYSEEESRELTAQSEGESLFERLYSRNKNLFETGEVIK